jgi:hypothetical protein
VFLYGNIAFEFGEKRRGKGNSEDHKTGKPGRKDIRDGRSYRNINLTCPEIHKNEYGC